MKASQGKSSSPTHLALCQKENHKHNMPTTLLNSGCWRRICEVAGAMQVGSDPFSIPARENPGICQDRFPLSKT